MTTKTKKHNLKLYAFIALGLLAAFILLSFVSASDTTAPVVAIMLSQDNNINAHNSNSYSLTIYAHLWNKEYQTSVTACQIDWGDGAGWQSVSVGTPANWYLVAHTYSNNGTKTVNYRCQNLDGLWSSGNVQHTNYDTIDIQLSAPATAIMLSQDNDINEHSTNSYLMTIYAHLWNNQSWYPVNECQIDWGDGAGWQSVSIGTMASWYLIPHTYSSQGLQTIDYRCRVNYGPWSSGNIQHTNYDTINISIAGDTTPPFIGFNSPQNITYNNSTIAINIAATGAQNVWFYNGTANETYSSPITRDFADGSHTLYAYANDSAGNFNQTSVTFFVNTSIPSGPVATIPVITITSPTNITYITSALTLNANANQPIDSWQYSLNGSANTTFTPGVTSLNLVNGSYNLFVYGTNINGTGSANVTFVVNTSAPADTTAPTINVISPINGATYLNSTISINFTASDINLANMWYFNGTANRTYTIPETTTLPNGQYTFIFYAGDTFGNINSTSRSFTINAASNNNTNIVDDNTNPNYNSGEIILKSSSANKTRTTSGTAAISAKAIDLTSKPNYSLYQQPLFWLVIAIIILAILAALIYFFKK